MSVNDILILLAIGFCAGLLSSILGIGGGIVVVPALVFIFGLSQKMAQGTSLAMLLPPIGILAVIVYHKSGNVKWDYAILLIIAFITGSYFGAKWVQGLNTLTAKRVFAIFMIMVAIKYLFFDKPEVADTDVKQTTEKTSL